VGKCCVLIKYKGERTQNPKIVPINSTEQHCSTGQKRFVSYGIAAMIHANPSTTVSCNVKDFNDAAHRHDTA